MGTLIEAAMEESIEDKVVENYVIRPSTETEAGLGLIINIKDFSGNPKSTRNGSDKDVENMKRTLEYLNLKVEVKTNLTQHQFLMAILDFTQQIENNNVDVCIVCIMSHGDEDSIVTSDNLTVKIEADILDRFANSYCQNMVGKPKLFLFQACRGEEVDPGMLVETGSRSTATDSVK